VKAAAASQKTKNKTSTTSAKPKSKRAKPSDNSANDNDHVVAASRGRGRATRASAAVAPAVAAPRPADYDRYPDKSIPDVLGCAIPLRQYCMSLPAVSEAFPWKHRVLKVGPEGRAKIFLYLSSTPGIDVGLCVKLPHSAEQVKRAYPNLTRDPGYGMGKHGWVAITIPEREEAFDTKGINMKQIKEWIHESYEAVAPSKKLLEQMKATIKEK